MQTQALTLSCDRLIEGEEASLLLLTAGDADVPEALAFRGVMPLRGPSVTFSRLQRGFYWMQLHAAGGLWRSEAISLGEEPVTIECGPFEQREER